MASETSVRKPVTPGSVKWLMLVEGAIICFLSYWVASEYTYSSYFRVYADQILLSHLTTYSAVIGVAVGLAGSITAAMIYKNLRKAKHRLGTVAMPKIRGGVEKLVSNISDPSSPSKVVTEQSASKSPAQLASLSATPVASISVQESKAETREKSN